jgi:transcriptional regulator with XRE-family HTH domain
VEVAREESFGARLRQFREAAGLTQEELAERARLSTNAISALERGQRRRPYPHTVRALADALDPSGNERAVLITAAPKRAGMAFTKPSGRETLAPPCRYRRRHSSGVRGMPRRCWRSSNAGRRGC